jgi:hypothetical protein
VVLCLYGLLAKGRGRCYVCVLWLCGRDMHGMEVLFKLHHPFLQPPDTVSQFVSLGLWLLTYYMHRFLPGSPRYLASGYRGGFLVSIPAVGKEPGASEDRTDYSSL